MFFSASHLSNNYGVDNTIARFFIDREPPKDNLYWEGKLMYLRPAPGYLFIPLIVDLLFKTGIEKQQLISEKFVSTMEQIGHFSALEETGQITALEAIEKCKELVKDECLNADWFKNLNNYFAGQPENFFSQLATPIKALHRGDIFLYSICALSFPPSLMEKIAEQWFALISTILLLDDAEDISTDKETGEINAFLEVGLSEEGIDKILQLLKKNMRAISTLNPSMALQLDEQFKDLMHQPHILQYLNQN